ncbi:MAG: 4-hydroxyacetophenone monooxygenase [Polyangiaceae bacterium]
MREHFAIIVGSGFAGLGMAIALRRAGIRDFVVLEKAAELGGTWRDNTYPGCACDVPSHVYSFSFAPNPRWSETYATQAEIRRYMEQVADQFDVRRHIRFRTEAEAAELDVASGRWTLTTADGEKLRARILVAGLGPLARFSLPDIPGLGSFRGKKFHSAAWDLCFEPEGKRIASIGTGASAIQFVPELAKSAAALHVFQRTPAWVLPRLERPYGEWEKQLFTSVPAARFLHRQAIFWRLELSSLPFAREPRLMRVAERWAIRHMEKSIRDPELRKKLTPSYRMGCKRILMSNTYYPALGQPNVEVVTSGVREITEDAIVDGDGVARPVDAIVFGTGFDVHDYLGKLRVTTSEGRDLGALWTEHGAQAHLGTTVAGFPNLFLLVGPNTGLGHNSIIFMIESQIALIMRCVKELRAAPDCTLEVREQAQLAYNEKIQRRLSRSVWQSGCRSWYLDGHGRNTTLWPGFCAEFRLATARFERGDYRLSPARTR